MATMERKSGWNTMTKEERSQEMMRRQEVARKNRLKRARNQPTIDSPFADLEQPNSVTGTTLREYITQLEAAVAQLKGFLGY